MSHSAKLGLSFIASLFWAAVAFGQMSLTGSSSTKRQALRGSSVRLAADGVPAREVMHQILEALPRRVTWRLNYDPTTTRYYLSFLLLPGEREP